MGILSLIFGSARGGGPPAAILGEEEGFVDIGLTITDVKTSHDGIFSMVARGKLKDKVIGLIVDVLPDWKAQKIDNTDTYFYWGKVRYRSLGEESDAFVATLNRLYGLGEKPGAMTARIEVNAVGLNSDPRQLKNVPAKMKAFFYANGPEDRYAEVYTNIDLQAKRLEFHEKDPEYRLPLIKALRDQAQQ